METRYEIWMSDVDVESADRGSIWTYQSKYDTLEQAHRRIEKYKAYDITDDEVWFYAIREIRIERVVIYQEHGDGS